MGERKGGEFCILILRRYLHVRNKRGCLEEITGMPLALNRGRTGDRSLPWTLGYTKWDPEKGL